MYGSKSLSDKIIDWIIIIILLVLGFSTLLPLINTLAISFSNKAAVSGGRVNLLPVGFNLNAYSYITQDASFWRAFFVSIERVILGGVLNFFLAILTAYPLSREVKEFPIRNVLMWVFVFGITLNVGLVPWFLTVDRFEADQHDLGTGIANCSAHLECRHPDGISFEISRKSWMRQRKSMAPIPGKSCGVSMCPSRYLPLPPSPFLAL